MLRINENRIFSIKQGICTTPSMVRKYCEEESRENGRAEGKKRREMLHPGHDTTITNSAAVLACTPVRDCQQPITGAGADKTTNNPR